MNLTLIRVGQSEKGTFGVLRLGPVPFVLTLEEPWRDNQQSISSIPVGQYVCQRVNSPKFGDTFEVTQVPGRSHILFHRGNTLHDTEGCILIGEKFGGTWWRPVLESSALGFAEFLDLLKGQSSFGLNIVEV